tara:strand:- start:256 stop:696 length:441 start_codon:yes stop_codon:yes gene_type:complete
MKDLTAQRDRIKSEMLHTEEDMTRMLLILTDSARYDYQLKRAALHRELAHTVELIRGTAKDDRETCCVCGAYDTAEGSHRIVSGGDVLICGWCEIDHGEGEWYVGYHDAADEGPFETREEAQEYADAHPGGPYDIAIIGNYKIEGA